MTAMNYNIKFVFYDFLEQQTSGMNVKTVGLRDNIPKTLHNKQPFSENFI